MKLGKFSVGDDVIVHGNMRGFVTEATFEYRGASMKDRPIKASYKVFPYEGEWLQNEFEEKYLELANPKEARVTKTIMKKKAMISQPMNGKSDEEIVRARDKAVDVLKEKGYEVINTLFTDDWYGAEEMIVRGVVQIPLCFLAKSLESMANCHAVYFCEGWEDARGCKIEHDAAVAYELDVIYEDDTRLVSLRSKKEAKNDQ